MLLKLKNSLLTLRENSFGIITLIVALIGGVPGACEVRDKYLVQRLKITINNTQTRIVRIVSDNEKKNQKIGIITQINLVGLTDRPTTAKEIKMFLNIDNKWIEGTNIKVKTVKSKNGKEVLVLRNQSEQIMMNFNYLTDQMYSKSITFGVPQIGYLIFMFDQKIEDIKRAHKLKITVFDYMGKSYEVIGTIEARHFALLNKDFVLVDLSEYFKKYYSNFNFNTENAFKSFEPFN